MPRSLLRPSPSSSSLLLPSSSAEMTHSPGIRQSSYWTRHPASRPVAHCEAHPRASSGSQSKIWTIWRRSSRLTLQFRCCGPSAAKSVRNRIDRLPAGVVLRRAMPHSRRGSSPSSKVTTSGEENPRARRSNEWPVEEVGRRSPRARSSCRRGPGRCRSGVAGMPHGVDMPAARAQYSVDFPWRGFRSRR